MFVLGRLPVGCGSWGLNPEPFGWESYIVATMQSMLLKNRETYMKLKQLSFADKSSSPELV